MQTAQHLPRKHLVIPDTQVRPGVPTRHLHWIGRYIVEKKPDVIIHLGDHWDFPSLSSYSRRLDLEGARVKADIDAGNDALDELTTPLLDYNEQRKRLKEKLYRPRMVMLRGNHEERLNRAIADNPQFQGLIGEFSFNDRRLGWEVHKFLAPVVIDGIVYCLASHHKVLTRDLRYVPLSDVRVGDELLAFDEHSPAPLCGRRYKTATVEAVGTDTRDLFEVELENGKTFQATADHLWLARQYGSSGWRWMRTDELIVGCSEACQVAPEWEPARTYDAGWLSGIFDGEGHISKPNAKQGGIQVGVAQRAGVVLDKILATLEALSVPHAIAGMGGTNNDVANVRILGASGEKLRLLGMVRPERIINKFRPEMLGRVQKMDGAGRSVVKAVRPVGRGEIVKIQTSTGTMIVEGYAHHNCHYFYNPLTGRPWAGTAHTKLRNIGMTFTMGHVQGIDSAHGITPDGRQRRALVVGSCYLHDEEYKGPQANHHWRGIIMKHEVRDGSYDLMEVSLDYLCRKYEGVPLSEWLAARPGLLRAA